MAFRRELRLYQVDRRMRLQGSAAPSTALNPKPVFARHQLPAHSPLTARALLAGMAGALGNDACAALASRVREHWRARELVFTGSGTDALTLVLRSLSPGRAPLVALPAYGCYDLATAALAANARIVLYDLDPQTLSPAHDSLITALQHQPDALVLVHLYGVPVDVPAIAQLAGPSGTLVIEDAAQGLGALLRGKPLGSFGSVAVLSFGRGKGLTGGAGGAVLANDQRGEAIVARITGLLNEPTAGWSQLVRAAAQWLLARPRLYALPAALPFLRLGETVYQPPHEPAAIARASLSMVNTIWQDAFEAAATRRDNAHRLLASVQRNPAWRSVHIEPDGSAGYLRLPLRAGDHLRERVLSTEARRLGIMPGYPLPLYELPGLPARCVGLERGFPGAAALASTLITLPTHGLLTISDHAALDGWLNRPSESTVRIPQVGPPQRVG